MSIVLEMSSEDVSRFWAKASKSEGCWEWVGTQDGAGYGKCLIQGKKCRPHRVAYELNFGPIPNGMVIDHRCHNRGCVNPDHLRLATRKQNAEHLGGAHADSISGVRGVYFTSRNQKWRARVQHNGKYYHGGYFTDLAEAEAAAIALRNKLFTHNDFDRKAPCSGASVAGVGA